MVGQHGSGVTCQHALDYPDCWVPFHEIGHLLLGDLERYNDANNGLWTVMGHRSTSVSYCMNAYEREQLGWITFGEATDNLEVDIPDFATTGTAYRMAYPGSEGFLEYYFENHQRLPSQYITVAPDGVFTYDIVDQLHVPQGGEPGQKGIYIVENDGYQFRVVCADGRWKWKSTGTMPNPFNPVYTAQIFVQDGVDRSLGRTDRRLQSGNYMGSDYYEPIWVWRDDVTNQPTWFSNARFNGDAHDAWHPDGNNLFSPWSNPAARLTYNPDLLPGAMNVLAENSDGSVRVHFYTTDLGDLPPSLPQAFHGTTTAGFDGITHPRFMWARNEEPSLTFGSVEIWRQLQPYGEVAGEWARLAVFPAGTESYVDESVAGARLTGGGNVARYKIRVIDGGGMESNYTKEWAMYYGDIPLKSVRHDANSSSRAASAIRAYRQDERIVVSSAGAATISIRLYDMLGREVFSHDMAQCANGACAVPLITSVLPSGHYRCIVYADGVPATQLPVAIAH
jgi:hypothetical protein